MSTRIKSPDWYRLQAAEIREKAEMIGGPYGVRLRRIAEHHSGGPVGVETLAAALAEARDTLEDVVEPFLIQEGLVLRTSRGRMLGDPGWRHLNLAAPPASAAQLDLLRDSPTPDE